MVFFGTLDVYPKQWAKQYVHDSAEQVYHWLLGLDLKFFPVVNWIERGQYKRGNSVPRYHVLWGTGHRLVERFEELLKNHPNRELWSQCTEKSNSYRHQSRCVRCQLAHQSRNHRRFQINTSRTCQTIKN